MTPLPHHGRPLVRAPCHHPQVARARSEFFKGKPARWRMAEPCALIIIFVTLGMILPLFFPCTPTQVLVWPCVFALACPCPGTCPACLPARPPARLPACPPACPPACLPVLSFLPRKSGGGLSFHTDLITLDPAAL